MDWLAMKKKGEEFFKKYKFVILIALIGVLFMLLPESESKENVQNKIEDPAAIAPDMEARLENVLSKIKGAGRVSVMLSVDVGEEFVFQTDEDVSDNSESIDTVTVTDSSRNQTGLIRKVIAQLYMGAVIVCEGGDDANVRLSIVDAVSKITGLGADRISVLKMR